MDDYVKHLEARNEELQQKLAKSSKDVEDCSIEMKIYTMYWEESKSFPSVSYGGSPSPTDKSQYTYKCDMFEAAVVYYAEEQELWQIDFIGMVVNVDKNGYASAEEARSSVEKFYNSRRKNLMASKRRLITGVGEWNM